MSGDGAHDTFKRRSKERRLTPSQKRFNKALSKARVVVEHTISRMKKFNIFGQEFRNRLGHYDPMKDIIPGLVNFKIMGTEELFARRAGRKRGELGDRRFKIVITQDVY
ncbi:MAG: transposase family protein [Thermoproteota archaeon]